MPASSPEIKFRDDTEIAKPLISRLLPAIAKDWDRVLHAQAHLYARVNHPEHLFHGENFDVDLIRGRFTGLFHGEIVSAGTLQVIGTYLTTRSTWLWAWENPSVAGNSWIQLKTRLGIDNELSSLLSCVSFQCGYEIACKLSAWIAWRTGFVGAYPAPYKEAIVYLALKINSPVVLDVESSEALWCTLCGRWPEQVETIYRGAQGFICSVCVKKFKEALEGDSRALPGLEATDHASISCVGCRGYGPRIFTENSSLCLECISFMSALAQKNT